MLSQQMLKSNCNEADGSLPNVYSGVIFDVRGVFNYGCFDGQCKYFNHEGPNNVSLLLILDMPLSLALDTTLLPMTVYKQIRYGDICKTQSASAGAEIHLVSLDVKPLNRTIAKGTAEQFTAAGTYSDGHAMDISAHVTWSSSDESKVTIDKSGVATAAEVGTVLITATAGNIVGSSTLTVAQWRQ
jgi:uncharacterized protein YceK